jgi:hypothetical protein
MGTCLGLLAPAGATVLQSWNARRAGREKRNGIVESSATSLGWCLLSVKITLIIKDFEA